MFMIDIETLGSREDSVILSLACIYFDPTQKPSPDQLRKDCFFIKFDVKDQVENYKRKIQKDTIEWWNKQCDLAKKKSFVRKSTDVSLIDGIQQFKLWVSEKDTNKKDWIWARGSLDEFVLKSVESQLNVEPTFTYNRWRDVRTAIDLLYNQTNGYCKVNYDGFDASLNIIKHNPIDDCVFDIMMLLYGEENE